MCASMLRRGPKLAVLIGMAAILLIQPGGAESTPARAAAGNFTLGITGPSSVGIRACCKPARITYTTTFTYVGPALGPPPNDARTVFTMRLPEQMHSPMTQWNSGDGVTGCGTQYGPSDSFGPLWTEFSCTLIFTNGHTSNTLTASVQPSGKLGTGDFHVTLSTGESGSVTTEFVREEPPPPPPEPPPPPPPAPIQGPAAAPTQTVSETFTDSGQSEPETATISSSAKTAQIALTWPDNGSSFDATGFRLLLKGQASARVLSAVYKKLKISKRRRANSLDVRIKRLKPGKLKFRIVARDVVQRTRVRVKIRQSKR
jgi:hypothetical protein